MIRLRTYYTDEEDRKCKTETAALVSENVLVDSTEVWIQKNMCGSASYNFKCAALSRLRRKLVDIGDRVSDR